jgi:hypothetical protein
MQEARMQEEESSDPRGDRSRERKERILHTRISEQLAEDIRAIAEDLRVPVSNLVRNVLEEAFSAVERVTGSVGELLDDVLEEAELASERLRRYRGRARERARARAQEGAAAEPASETPEPGHEEATSEASSDDPLARVVAWQPVVLAAPRRCARSGRMLHPGERAYLGLGERGSLGVYLAADALDPPAA